MRVIFLDMDGVLCTERAHIAQGYQNMSNHGGLMDALDREGVGMLNAFHNKYADTVYVLSSTWRRHHTRTEMEEWLQRYQWDGKFHDDWHTPVFYNQPRGDEIKDWLIRHPEVTNYIILDDSSDMLEEQKFHFVQTDDYNGIRSENYWHMERIFDFDEKNQNG